MTKWARLFELRKENIRQRETMSRDSRVPVATCGKFLERNLITSHESEETRDSRAQVAPRDSRFASGKIRTVLRLFVYFCLGCLYVLSMC